VDRIKELCLELKNRVQLKTEEAIEQDHNEKIEKEYIESYQANEKAKMSLKRKNRSFKLSIANGINIYDRVLFLKINWKIQLWPFSLEKNQLFYHTIK